ncbi:MAG TPA: DUF2939 domain-containing protein [Caulobacteraceae bacterium]|nr:DUF2939 domain-containing protein [Caulobacteraceae bacterium]
MKALAPLIALLAAGCATTTRLDAAGDVHDLLVSIRDNDRKAFERHVDRDALKRQIEGRMVRETRSSPAPEGLKALGYAFAQPAAEMASAMLIQPHALRLAAEHYGYTPDQPIPGRLAIAGSLKDLGERQVCVTRTKGGPCLLTFTERGGNWKLTSFEGELKDLRAGLAAAKGGS